jgi:hypothetical protein
VIAEWATSDDRGVTVLAAPGGVPLDVRIEPSALHQRPDVLARIVRDTAALAGRRATRRLHAELSTTVGPEAAKTLDRVGLSVPAELDPDDEGFGGILGIQR